MGAGALYGAGGTPMSAAIAEPALAITANAAARSESFFNTDPMAVAKAQSKHCTVHSTVSNTYHRPGSGLLRTGHNRRISRPTFRSRVVSHGHHQLFRAAGGDRQLAPSHPPPPSPPPRPPPAP